MDYPENGSTSGSIAPSSSRTLHGLFEDKVRDAPEQIALEYEGERITYDELNRRANKIAHYLRDTAGVRPDGRVGIIARHPPSFVIATMATLKAGGAYVPIDPDSPAGVTQQILNDARPVALLVDSHLAASAACFDGNVFILDVMGGSVPTPDMNPCVLAGSRDLAYVIYTSGTTGVPKGVAIEHAAILNTVIWRNSYYGFLPSDVVLNFSKPSFDSSVEDVFCALTAGGRLILPQRARITDHEYITELTRRHGVTHFLITPALYKRILRGMHSGHAPSLRSVAVAGEWFTPSLVREHYQKLPQVKLYNEYGPAENAVCSTVHPLGPSDDKVLIGKAIDNVKAFVVDDDGRQVGVGETGELCLAGAGLARGYLDNPELTDEKFTAIPSIENGITRLYCTGDIVRVCDDGNFQFVGRQDRQIKIRGQRVELDHIAECLASDEAVEDIFVLSHTTASGRSSIVAFAVGPGPAEIERLYLTARQSLPSYMVPAAIVGVAAIPVTPQGKVDERALVRSLAGMTGSGDAEPVPASDLETSLLVIWQKVLERQDMGLDDNFFTLGGDSLTVVDLVAEIRDSTGVDVAVAMIYDDRTIRNLAKRMGGQN